ncbi:Larval cuticle protein 16/17 [Amphibalanus amphitrite]|uniref:Larval cuticle protein 16/17 n=1 Tax=Amphibalanus amphitrite TaxID=1232801 RepID=A0A6A4WPP0_AMPAM|nr:endocuticle structural glycoprotein SgAbd-1-like [Amphibalanus amphitrite]KAF0309337.1 Larval cuticle protein 16/17 [Amphibalanus amphitrite]
MKLIVLFCLVAVALAQDEKDAQIIRQDYQLNEDGSFQADLETSNQIVATRSGQSIPGNEPETGSYKMSGEYSYIAPDGTPIRVTWEADELGYRAQSDVIPTV